MGFFCCCQETSPVKAMSGVSKKNLLKNFITVDLSMKNPPVRANRRIWCILRAMERILEKQIGYLSNVKQCNTLQCSTCWSLFRHTSRYDRFPAHWFNLFLQPGRPALQGRWPSAFISRPVISQCAATLQCRSGVNAKENKYLSHVGFSIEVSHAQTASDANIFLRN